MISGFSIVRNAVKLKYPMRECLLALHNVCDEVVLGVDPGTQDGTIELARELSGELGTRLFEDPWDMENRNAGTEIGIRTQRTMEQCNFEWTLYCQMDEAIHESDRERLHDLTKLAGDEVNGFSFPRPYFWRDLKTIRKDWSPEVIRLTRQGTHNYATLDGHSCETLKGRVERSGIWLFHYSRMGDPQVIANRIRNIDEFFHAPETLIPWEDLNPYDFGTRAWDNTSLIETPPEVEGNFANYIGSHPAPFAKLYEFSR